MSTMPAQRRTFSPEFGQRVTVDRNSLQMTDELSFDEWVQLGRKLTEVGDSMAWWVGDWIEQGTVVYGGKYEQALEVMALEYQTLRNYARVAKSFAVVSRRRDKLSFGHHEAVASLNAAEQDAFLDNAERHGWSVRELREHVRASRALPADTSSHITLERLTLTVPEDRAHMWKEAAADAGLSFEEWCSNTLDEASMVG